mmetsp:Transcript_37361/g.88322  ORF Transcript_37361/g.88322 Transcript_37361/m.88322 type:complete len:402 (+) Transcript_37361:281-1486(+)
MSGLLLVLLRELEDVHRLRGLLWLLLLLHLLGRQPLLLVLGRRQPPSPFDLLLLLWHSLGEGGGDGATAGDERREHREHARRRARAPDDRAHACAALLDGLVLELAELVRHLGSLEVLQDLAHVLDVLLDDGLEEGHKVQQLCVLQIIVPRLDADAVERLVRVADRVVVDDDDVAQVAVQVRQVLDVLAVDILGVLTEQRARHIPQLLEVLRDRHPIAAHRRGEDNNLVELRHVREERLKAGTLLRAVSPLPVPLRVDKYVLQTQHERALNGTRRKLWLIREELPSRQTACLCWLYHPIHPAAQPNEPQNPVCEPLRRRLWLRSGFAFGKSRLLERQRRYGASSNRQTAHCYPPCIGICFCSRSAAMEAEVPGARKLSPRECTCTLNSSSPPLRARVRDHC